MHCSSCGLENRPDLAFCTGCGSKLQAVCPLPVVRLANRRIHSAGDAASQCRQPRWQPLPYRLPPTNQPPSPVADTR